MIRHIVLQGVSGPWRINKKRVFQLIFMVKLTKWSDWSQQVI